MITRTTVLLFFLCYTNSAKLPSVFLKCNRKDPNLKECLLKAAQHGIHQLERPVLKDLKVPNANPFEVSEITLQAGSGPVQVVQNFKNCTLTGFHNAKFDEFDWNFDTDPRLYFKGVFPEIDIRCQYDFDGRVLLLPVKGKGPGRILLSGVKFVANFKMEHYRKKGFTYIKTMSTELDFDPAKVFFNFETLFGGNRELTDNINTVLNENWKDVFEDVKSGYVEAVKQIIVSLIDSFFSRLSIEELLD